MNIRQATPKDIETLVEMRVAFLSEFHHIDDETKTALVPLLHAFFEKHIGTKDFACLVGEVEGEISNTALAMVSDCPPSDQYPNGRVGYIYNVYTKPAFRKRGCATQLVKELVALAREKGASSLNLNASAAGKPIYDSLGFDALAETAMRLRML